MDTDGGTTRAPRPITPDLLRAWPLPETSGTKYARGQVLVIGGSTTTPGAVMLAGVAALDSALIAATLKRGGLFVPPDEH